MHNLYNISDAADLDYIDSVLGEVWDSEYFHPAVFALENKREALGAFLSGKKQTQELLTGKADTLGL